MAVAFCAEPRLGSEMVSDEAGTHSRHFRDLPDPHVEPVAAETVDRRISDPRLGVKVAP